MAVSSNSMSQFTHFISLMHASEEEDLPQSRERSEADVCLSLHLRSSRVPADILHVLCDPSLNSNYSHDQQSATFSDLLLQTRHVVTGTQAAPGQGFAHRPLLSCKTTLPNQQSA